MRLLIREISSSCSADVPDVTAAVEQPDLLKYIQRSLSRPVEQRYRKVIRRQSVRSRDCSAERKSAHLIKKCNDFGAGGVSVAIGELADGLSGRFGQSTEEICRT